MARQYTKLEHPAGIVKERKAAGETNRAIAESYGLTLKQIKKLVNRQNRKERLLELLQKAFLRKMRTKNPLSIAN